MTSACCCAARMVIAMLAHVDLCSGIGGFALGFQWAGLSEPVLFCDIEPWSRQVLAKHWPDVPIAKDVKELASDPARLVPDCDILSCGYPCQPFSQAGIRRGEKDDRHVWPKIFTIVQAKRPRWIVCENVAGHISLGLDQVLSDLEGEGYAIQPFVIPACAVDAPHRRDRVWIVANSDDAGQPASAGPGQDNRNQPRDDTRRRSADVADACGRRHRVEEEKIFAGGNAPVVGGARASDVGHADGGDCSRHDKATDQGWRQQGLATGCEDVADARREGLYESRCLRNVEPKAEQQSRVQWDDASGGTKKEKQDVADAKSQRIQGHRPSGEQVPHSQERQGLPLCGDERPATAVSQSQSELGRMVDGLSTWLDEPRDIPRVATGVKQRAARLKGLGNAIVPAIAMQIGLTIKAVENG